MAHTRDIQGENQEYNLESQSSNGKWYKGSKLSHVYFKNDWEALAWFVPDASHFYPGQPKRLRKISTNEILAVYKFKGTFATGAVGTVYDRAGNILNQKVFPAENR